MPRKSIRAATLVLLLIMLPVHATLSGQSPAQWHESDWIKFVDSAISIVLGEAVGAAGGIVPIVDVYAALSAVGGATKLGLQQHLRTKMVNAESAGDIKKFDRYNAFYVCLTYAACDELKALEAELDKQVAPPSGVLVASLVVPNTKPEKVTTDIVLEEGRIYRIRAYGVISDWRDKEDGVDAVWCYAEWRCGTEGAVWAQLRIDNKGMHDIAGETIPYNPSHEYEIEYQGQGKRLEFHLYDAMGSSSDNTGEIYVDIYR